MENIENLEKVYLWLGITNKSEEEFNQYFELDYSTEGDFDNPNYKVCGFCKDTGQLWYDEDFIGYIWFDEKLSITEILEDEAPIDETEWKKIKKICKELGITKANAIIWYSDASFEISQPYKDNYCGLQYIGLFQGD